jgi:hypothetical protein
MHTPAPEASMPAPNALQTSTHVRQAQERPVMMIYFAHQTSLEPMSEPLRKSQTINQEKRVEGTTLRILAVANSPPHAHSMEKEAMHKLESVHAPPATLILESPIAISQSMAMERSATHTMERPISISQSMTMESPMAISKTATISRLTPARLIAVKRIRVKKSGKNNEEVVRLVAMDSNTRSKKSQNTHSKRPVSSDVDE